MKRILACVALCGWLVVPVAQLQAHHSVAGAYKLGQEAKVSGTFIAFRMTNPHSSLKLNVNSQDGSTTEWSFTGGSATQLARLGMGRTGSNELRSGENIT